VSSSMVLAIVAFAASLAGAAWLSQRGRMRAGFALLVAAPVIGALTAAASINYAANRSTSTPASPPLVASTAPAPSPQATNAQPAAPATASSIQPSVEIDSWRRKAEQLRRDKHFAEARDLYQRIVSASPGDADAWADLADAAAAAADGDLRVGANAIERALQVDPNHLKGLWLKASLELQEKRYGSAADIWQRLLSHLPPESSDAKIVNENLAETRRLAAQQGAAK